MSEMNRPGFTFPVPISRCSISETLHLAYGGGFYRMCSRLYRLGERITRKRAWVLLPMPQVINILRKNVLCPVHPSCLGSVLEVFLRV